MNKIIKRNICIGLALLFMLCIRYIPAPIGMNQSGMTVIGIFLGSLLLWLTVAIDWPSILCLFLIGLIPEIGFKTIYASSFGNETFIFLMSTFLCTYVLAETPFLKRCALYFITSSVAKKGPWLFIMSLLFSIIFIGLFVSPTVLFVLFLPILEKINEILGVKKGDKIGKLLMIGLAFAVSISSGMTPIAHIFSIMAMGFYTTATGNIISYADYMAFAIPVGIICMIMLILAFRFLINPDISKLENIDVSFMKQELKPMDRKEKTVVGIFILIVCLWIFPSILKNIIPIVSLINKMGTAMPPILGVILYSIITFEGQPLLNFIDGMKKGVQWSSLIMCAGTLGIGIAMTNSKIGLTEYLIDILNPILQGVSPMLLILFLVTWACVQTNLSSNMVTVTVVTTVAIPLVEATNGIVSSSAIVSLIGMMSAYAFATPPAMPHIAMAIGSGWVDTGTVLKYGFLLMIISIITSILIGYPIASNLM